MKTTVFAITLIALGGVFAGSASAQCGSPAAYRQGLFLPLLTTLEQATTSETSAAPQSDDDRANVSIVGLWDVKFISGGQLYDEGFDQFHSDGLEIMNDIPPPSSGNVCLGVWKSVGSQVKLRHPFWIFDNGGNLIGRGVLLEDITLNSNGQKYTGSFTFQFRDLSGNTIPSMPDVSGSLQAQRITP